MAMHNKPMQPRGFTLVESLVTLSILGVGVAGVTRLQVDLLRAAGQAKARSEALAQVEQRLETLHGWQPGLPRRPRKRPALVPSKETKHPL